MTTKTRTVPTKHGEVEYETVDCSSCQSEVRKEDAYGFVVYDNDRLKREHDWGDYHEWEIYNDGYTTGYACEYCREDGPIEYPTANPPQNSILSGLAVSWEEVPFVLIPIVGIYPAIDMIADPHKNGEVVAGIIGLIAHIVVFGAVAWLLAAQ